MFKLNLKENENLMFHGHVRKAPKGAQKVVGDGKSQWSSGLERVGGRRPHQSPMW